MGHIQTKLIQDNRTQMVRIPEEIAFPESVKDVEIMVIGNKRVIAPAGESWDDWFDAPGVSCDFMTERRQPGDQGRDIL